jgi:8-oxo-dGTP diphosphatase
MPYTYKYPRPAVTTDIILTTGEPTISHILLIERKHDPYKGLWALPGGFVDMDEDLEDACLRELKEETGIENVKISQFLTIGTPGRDPRGRTITIVYRAHIDTMVKPIAGDDAANAKWFETDKLPELAFDHLEIINKFKELIS